MYVVVLFCMWRCSDLCSHSMSVYSCVVRFGVLICSANGQWIPITANAAKI